MRALVFREFGGPLAVERIPDPTPPPDGVVVRVERTGLCRSDWHGWQGHDPSIVLPHVPGHELAGVVVARGAEVTDARVGDRVTVPFVGGCGECPTCRAGNPQVCDAQSQPGFTHFGSFAELVVLHRADLNVVRLPTDFDFEVAASLGCRFVTAYRALVELARLSAGETLVVFGAGGVGLSAVLIARALGARSVVVDIANEKLELATRLGADEVLDARTTDVVGAVVEMTRGGANVGLDALGSPHTLRQSLCALAKRGRHVQVGLLLGSESSAKIPMDRIVSYELQLYGSHGIAAGSYPAVFDLVTRSKIPLREMVTQTIGLEGLPAELEGMSRFAGTGVTLVEPARMEEA